LHDIFDLQDQITQQIAASIFTQIPLNFGENVKGLERPDLKTWDLMARSWKLHNELTEESLAEAETLYRRAVASAPASSTAHSGLASVLFHQVWMGHASDTKAAISEAYKLGKTAVRLNEYLEYAHWILGLIQLIRGKHDMAIAELERAVELNPNMSIAYGSLGTVLAFSEESDESIRNNEIAIRMDPKNPAIFFRFSGIAMAHFVAGRYSEAADECFQDEIIRRKGAGSNKRLSNLEGRL